jgi:hypothetical protein
MLINNTYQKDCYSLLNDKKIAGLIDENSMTKTVHFCIKYACLYMHRVGTRLDTGLQSSDFRSGTINGY